MDIPLERREALSGFLREDYRRLFAFVLSLVHDPDAAQDVVQEACQTMLEKFDQYDPARPFCGWAFGIARNKALQYLERSRCHEQLDPAVVDRLTALWGEKADNGEQRGMDALRHCLSRLHERQRQLVLSCYDGTRTVKQVAESLGRSASSVHNSLARIRVALFGCVKRILDREASR